MGETTDELSNHRYVIDIFENIKRLKVKKDSKDKTVDISRKSGSYIKSFAGFFKVRQLEEPSNE